MIHILLTILKILGILLLIILGIVLFLVLAILFVPFRYAVWGEKYGSNIKGKVVFSWLAHLVHFRFVIENKEKHMELYLFGIPVFASKNKITAICQKLKKNKDTLKDDTNASMEDITQVIEGESQEGQKSEDIDVSDGTTTEETIEVLEVDEPVFEEKVSELDSDSAMESISLEETSTTAEKKNPIKNLIQTIKDIPTKIKSSIEKIKLTIKNICGKIKQGSDFLKTEATKETIRLLLGKLKLILVHILPKKMRGDITFGFDDPALTGELLGVLAMFYPKYHNKLKINPVFDQMILEGNVMVKGRIIVAYLIWQAVKILLDKNVKITWKNIRSMMKIQK